MINASINRATSKSLSTKSWKTRESLRVILLQYITLLCNVYLSNSKQRSLSANPFLIVVSIVLTIFISSSSKVYFLPQTFTMLLLIVDCRDRRTFGRLVIERQARKGMNWWTPGTARNQMIRSERPIELIKIWLAKISKCIKSLLNFLSVYHFSL